MFKSFRELFSHKNLDSIENKELNKTNFKPLPWQSVVLNNKSPLQDISINNDIKLWTHQKAMLARCIYIENNPYKCETKTLHTERYLNKDTIKDKESVAIGILNDPPGTGKTNVVLSLISLDKQQTFNIIIVPKNLIGQWKTAINKFFHIKTNLLWKECDYSSITELYMRQNALDKYKIVLIDETLVDTFALAYNSKATRVIIDEVDNVNGCMTQHINCNQLWFMSASYSLYDQDKDNYKLPYKINQDYIGNIICRCESEFIKESIKLIEPTSELIICDDSDLLIFNNVIPNDVMKSLHALNKRPLKKLLEYLNSDDISNKELAEWYMEELKKKIIVFDEDLLILRKKMNENTFDHKDEIYQSNYDDLLKKKIESEKLLLILENNLKVYKEPNIEKTKNYIIHNIIFKRIKELPTSKWLIFNDDIEALFILETELNNNKISTIMLDSGTSKAVEETLTKYKENVQVCLINSSLEACGLNLENTTDILFMQATNEELLQQVVGRAQRFGRETILNIICIFDKIEYENLR